MVLLDRDIARAMQALKACLFEGRKQTEEFMSIRGKENSNNILDNKEYIADLLYQVSLIQLGLDDSEV